MSAPSRRSAMFELSGKVAVVTGGSRGIGRAMAEGLAAAGADLVVASRKLDACERAAREIAETTGRRVLPVRCHVGDWADCDALVETVYAELGHCEVLVNNAGMSPLYDGLTAVTAELRTEEPGGGSIPIAPWGVQLAGNFSKAAALASFARAQQRYQRIVGAVQPMVVYGVVRSRGVLPFYRVMIPEAARIDAQRTCGAILAIGGACVERRS